MRVVYQGGEKEGLSSRMGKMGGVERREEGMKRIKGERSEER